MAISEVLDNDVHQSDGEEISRRNFLRLMTAIPVGAAVGLALEPSLEKVTDEVNEHTPIQTGNAAVLEEATDGCVPKHTVQECVDEYTTSTLFRVESDIFDPVVEETIFRALPSLVTDITVPKILDPKFHVTDPVAQQAIDNMFVGTRTLKTTRREATIGAISSVIFGLMHNVTNKGIATNRLPLAQLLGGGVLWGLQRKLGLGANVAAHAAYNAKVNKWGS